ncbi:MAG: hypothetical protein CSA58_07095 [Micrococcales bacterium]|nr:MAG: hypothetical protein CSA58_07095 [Micrococcales bacterium]
MVYFDSQPTLVVHRRFGGVSLPTMGGLQVELEPGVPDRLSVENPDGFLSVPVTLTRLSPDRAVLGVRA